MLWSGITYALTLCLHPVKLPSSAGGHIHSICQVPLGNMPKAGLSRKICYPVYSAKAPDAALVPRNQSSLLASFGEQGEGTRGSGCPSCSTDLSTSKADKSGFLSLVNKEMWGGVEGIQILLEEESLSQLWGLEWMSTMQGSTGKTHSRQNSCPFAQIVLPVQHH